MTINRIDRNRLIVGIRKYMLSEIDNDVLDAEYFCAFIDRLSSFVKKNNIVAR
jgi:uncharacterized protein (DUF2164 family)